LSCWQDGCADGALRRPRTYHRAALRFFKGQAGATWVEIAGVLTGIVLAVAAVVALTRDDGGAPAKRWPPAGHVELDQALIRNGPAIYRTVGTEGVQTRASTPTLDLTLINHGSQRVLLLGARITILAYASFPICFSQGGGGGPLPASPP